MVQRVLIASTALLSLALAALLWQRFGPGSGRSAAPVAAQAPAPAPEPASPPPSEAPASAAAPTPSAPTAAPAPAPAPTAVAAPPAHPASGATPRPAPGRRALGAEAMAAIFTDRPGTGAPRQRPPRSLPPPLPAIRAAPAAPTAARTRAPRGSAPRVAAGPPPAPVAARPPVDPGLPAAVAGTLRAPSGAPLPGVTVLAISAGGDDARETVTDDDGFYLLAAVAPGRWTLFSGLGTPVEALIPARSLEARPGAISRVDLQGGRAGATIRIQAIGPGGQPISSQAVLLRGEPDAPPPATLLGDREIFFPERRGSESVLRGIPDGTYAVVILEAGTRPPRLVRAPLAVAGPAERRLTVRLPEDLGGPAALP